MKLKAVLLFSKSASFWFIYSYDLLAFYQVDLMHKVAGAACWSSFVCFFISRADCIGTQWSCTDFQLAKGSEVCSKRKDCSPGKLLSPELEEKHQRVL